MRYLPILLLLTGCASPAPEVIEITRTEYIPVPPHLVADCAVSFSDPVTNGELLEQRNKYQAAMEQCERQLGEIRGLR